MNCTCARSYRCPPHRLMNARLAELAKNFEVSAEQWHQAVARLEVDDLHLLLEPTP